MAAKIPHSSLNRERMQDANPAVWRRIELFSGENMGISAFHGKFYLTSRQRVKYTIIAFAWNNVPPAAARFYICSNSLDDRSV